MEAEDTWLHNLWGKVSSETVNALWPRIVLSLVMNVGVQSCHIALATRVAFFRVLKVQGAAPL